MEYQCQDCAGVIHVGDTYYNRNKDYTILCMECYRKRNELWRRKRDTSAREQSLLEDLRKRPRTALELQTKYGTGYTRLLRKLRLNGYPVGRRRDGMAVHYYLDEE
jgi:hypothetical protein